MNAYLFLHLINVEININNVELIELLAYEKQKVSMLFSLHPHEKLKSL